MLATRKRLRWVVIMARVVTVNDVLDGHVKLDIECLDRIYLNAYVPILQTTSQVVAFLSGHLGFPFPSPVLFKQIGDRFRRGVAAFAEANHIPWIKFGKRTSPSLRAFRSTSSTLAPAA
ncbi:hypothetical protein [Nonomuraea dietziae]|uniref:hypothetical protein n=1 Tax=Nonomuraea dietziae TaxID=65515 RepID=UPI00344AA4E3